MRETVVRWRALGVALLGIASAACADATGPTEPLYAPSLFAEVPLTQEISLCKTGPEGSWASFSISATGGDLLQGTSVTITGVKPFGTFPAACAVIWRSTGPTVEYVTITETASSPGTELESIAVFNDAYQVDLVTGTASVTVSNLEGALVIYKNKAVPLPPTGRIGDFVWSDTNQDGIQDLGEDGIGGVLVTLSVAGNPVATTTTSATGGYLFTGLTAGCYAVSVGTPAGMTASPSLASGGTPATDSNGSPANVCLPTDSSEDLTIDFGFYTPVPPPPPGIGGCTPGFWRQTQHYQFWTGYTPSQPWSAVFATPAASKQGTFSASTPLGKVIELGGGGMQALGRHAVAALLNAASADVNYPLTQAQVIQLVNNAMANGTIEAAKNQLDHYNNLGCTAKP